MKKALKIVMISLSVAGSACIAVTPANALTSICDVESTSFSVWFYKMMVCR